MTNNLMEKMEIKREDLMEILKEYCEGNPKTSWDYVLNGVLCWFESYCDDEASNWLEKRYENGEVDTNELLWEFEQFVWGLNIYEFDDFDEEE